MSARSLGLFTLYLTAFISTAGQSETLIKPKGIPKKQISSQSIQPPAIINFAQTHIIPPQGTTWNLAGIPADQQQRTLKLVGNRASLCIVQINTPLNTDEVPYIQILNLQGGERDVALNSSTNFPATEALGPMYPQAGYWIRLSGEYVTTGIQARVIAKSPKGTRVILPYQPVEVGSSPTLTIRPINLYLFGSNPTNYQSPLVFDTPLIDEYFAKVPVAQVVFDPLPDIIWDYLVIPPSVRGIPQPAFIQRDADLMADNSFNGPVSGGFYVINAIQEANGEKRIPHFYYGVTLTKYSNGDIYWGGGAGFNYANYGIGDPYEGVFFHELGHAYGMPHAEDGYNEQRYPYIGGSLLGSAWGYDSNRNILLGPFVPKDVAVPPVNCTWGGMILQKDAQGLCIKQDPMQGGAGLQSIQDKFAMFSDYNAAEVQWDMEGETTVAADGTHILSNELWGLAEEDPSFKSGYRRWDKIYKKYVEFTPPQGPQNSMYGWNRALPIVKGVPIHAIVVTLSSDPTPGLTQIYPPLHFIGNLIQYIDPTDSTQLASIDLNNGQYKNYCTINGCDYTLRVTYNDGSTLYRLIPKGFRLGPVNEDPVAHDPTSWASLQVIGVNVPATKALSKIELLNTPQAYNKDPSYFTNAPAIDTRTTNLN